MSDQPSPPASPEAAPAWAGSAGPREAFLRGLALFISTPSAVLFAGALGFGALVRDMGLGLDFAIWSSFLFYALPAQVVLADQLGRGASMIAAAFAVSLTSIRMTPMAVTITPLLRDTRGRRWRELIAVHCIAVTAWIEGLRRLPSLPPGLRLPHFTGLGIAFMLSTACGSAIGFLIAGSVPVAVSAALLFFTPSYFLLSMLATGRALADRLSILLGFLIGPVVYVWAPDLDLLVAGLAGGTIAYMAGRRG